MEPGHGSSSRKRTRATSVDLDDEYGFGAGEDLSRDDLEHVMTAVETPRKAVKTSEIRTPSTRRTLPWNQEHHDSFNISELQTPQSARTTRVDPFSSRLGGSLLTPSCPVNAAHQTATPSSSPYETPTPSRFKDVGVTDLFHDVLSLLQAANIKLSTTTESNLNGLLSKHVKAAEGLKRGRDVTRMTIKARDAKITELSYRVSTLEAELEAEKAMVRHLQWEAQIEEQTSP